MSFLGQMKPPGLTDLSLILFLVSISKGQNWNINVSRTITATLGSNVIIKCTFSYPTKHYNKHLQVYWKKPEKSNFDTLDIDQNAFVFHPNDSFVLEKYRGQTKLIGNISNGDCSLEILSLKDQEPEIYVRVIAKGDQYSFRKKFVSIYVSGVTSVTFNPDVLGQPLITVKPTTMGPTQKTSTMYMIIFLPVAGLLIIFFVAGIVFCTKYKRSPPFTREESGYYANFSQASSNQANRKASCNKQENQKLPELKAIDDPVYINIEAAQHQMDQSMDCTDNIYANVDYSK